MKKIILKKELPVLIIVLIPIIYFIYFWKSIPNMVPIQFSISGEPTNWTTKNLFMYFVIGINISIYVLFNLIPFIDPNKKFDVNSKNYYKLKFSMLLFISVLSLFSLKSAVDLQFRMQNSIMLLIGFLFMVLGNYFQTIPQNYFLGIKTPWTLANEFVWKKTHDLAGKLFFITGIILIVLYIANFPNETLFITLIIISVFVPIIYSFIIYKKLERI